MYEPIVNITLHNTGLYYLNKKYVLFHHMDLYWDIVL